jgi:hypothetical protein
MAQCRGLMELLVNRCEWWKLERRNERADDGTFRFAEPSEYYGVFAFWQSPDDYTTAVPTAACCRVVEQTQRSEICIKPTDGGPVCKS